MTLTKCGSFNTYFPGHWMYPFGLKPLFCFGKFFPLIFPWIPTATFVTTNVFFFFFLKQADCHCGYSIILGILVPFLTRSSLLHKSFDWNSSEEVQSMSVGIIHFIVSHQKTITQLQIGSNSRMRNIFLEAPKSSPETLVVSRQLFLVFFFPS